MRVANFVAGVGRLGPCVLRDELAQGSGVRPGGAGPQEDYARLAGPVCVSSSDLGPLSSGGFQRTSQHREVLEVVMGSESGWVGRPGPVPLTARRQEFAGLIARGVSNSGACRMVGVNRRTGTRWRYGRTVTSSSGAELHYQPMTTTTALLSARFLSEDERVVIGDRVRAGSSLRAIGGELGRPASTISREVHRNGDAESGHYRPFAAHRLALARLARPRERRLAGDPVLREQVQRWLDRRWGPEQIANTLRAEFPDNPAWHLVHESIYQAIYAKDATLGRDRFACLRTRRRRRRPHRKPDG